MLLHIHYILSHISHCSIGTHLNLNPPKVHRYFTSVLTVRVLYVHVLYIIQTNEECVHIRSARA